MFVTHVLLKSIPYILSIAGGIIVFDISQRYVHATGLVELMSNVAASLLSIPLVFLLYDYSNFLITRRVAKQQTKVLLNTLDDYMFRILTQIKRIANLSDEAIDIPIQDISLNSRKLNVEPRYLRAIQKQLKLLEELLYKTDKTENLEPQQTQILSLIAQELNQLVNESRYHSTPKEIARHIETTLAMIDDWFTVTGYITRKKLRYSK